MKKHDPTWKHSNKWSSCSGEKSQASFANRSCTFFTMASCFPDYKELQTVNLSNIMRKLFLEYKQNCMHWGNTWASHSLSRSSEVRAFSLIINRSIFSSFSTYWGWWRLSRKTIVSTPFFWIHSCNTHLILKSILQ